MAELLSPESLIADLEETLRQRHAIGEVRSPVQRSAPLLPLKLQYFVAHFEPVWRIEIVDRVVPE